MRGVAPPKMPLAGQGGQRQAELGGPQPGGLTLWRDARLLGPWDTPPSACLGRRGTKRRADRVDTSTLAPRSMVRCADYIHVLAINVFQIGAATRRRRGAGELVVPPRRFLLQQTRNTSEGHTSGGLGTPASASCHVRSIVIHHCLVLLSAVSARTAQRVSVCTALVIYYSSTCPW